MRILFWNVDTQKDFMLSNGSLYIKGAEEIVANLDFLTRAAKTLNIKVVNTMDYHMPKDEELSDNPDFVNTFPDHCMAMQDGSSFIEATYPHRFGRESYYILTSGSFDLDMEMIDKARNIIIPKNKFDVFLGNKNTSALVEYIKPDMVYVYGVATNVCVNCAVLGLLGRKYNVTVVSDAVKELPNSDVDSIFKEWVRLGAKFVETDDLLKQLI